MIIETDHGTFRVTLIMKDGARVAPGKIAPYKLCDIDHAEYERLL